MKNEEKYINSLADSNFSIYRIFPPVMEI